MIISPILLKLQAIKQPRKCQKLIYDLWLGLETGLYR